MSLRLFLFCFLSLSFLFAGPVCNKKSGYIEKEIEYAKKHGQTYRVDGLEKALKELNSHCDDDDEISKLKDKIEKYQFKIEEVRAEIQENNKKGKLSKAKEKSLKLESIQLDLENALAELKSLES